jgi:phospholipase D1/2
MSQTSFDTLLKRGDNCCAVALADRLVMLVDGERYFDAFMRAAQCAQRSLIMLGWDFDSRTALRVSEDGQAQITLGDFLNDLARSRRRLHVRMLDWDYPMVFGMDRQFPPLYGLSWKPHRRVHFRYDNTHPVGGSHHQKIVVIDDKVAFVGGFDITCRRWDTRAHRANDPRRLAANKPYPPFHDVMVALDGEAARAIAQIAHQRWKEATGEELTPVKVTADPWPEGIEPQMRDAQVGIACTTPAKQVGEGVRDVERLYLDMIGRARRYIYIENQYFTAQKVGAALAQRLREPDGPEIVLVTRLLSHGWLEEMTMEVLRTKLIRDLRAADRYGRFQVYYPDIVGLAEGTCVDVHSKLMIVDDQWLRIGSANISNRSMGLDTECDVVVEAQDNLEISRVIRQFRDDLIAEHTGAPVREVALAIRRCGALNAAIDALASPERALRPVADVDKWSDAVLATVALADPERPVSVEALVEQFAPDVEVHRAKPLWKKAAWTLLALIGLALIWRYTPLAEALTADQVSAWAQDMSRYWWAPVIVVLAYTPASLIMFPRPLITLAAVVAFGAWLGFLYAIGGILLSAALHYYAGRMLDRDTVRRLAGEKLNRMTHVLRRRGLLAITALRLLPLAPFAVEGFVAGAVRIKLWHFLVGTFIGVLPGALAATVFADQLQTALDDSAKINWWLVAAVAMLFIVAIVWVRRWFNRQEIRPKLESGDGEQERPDRIDPVVRIKRAPERGRTLTAVDVDRF